MTAAAADAARMAEALRLAARGACTASPNPLVGCLVAAADGRVAGRGFHRRAGEPHAEALALAEAGAAARGGTLYVTLEPCVHQGRTPPCLPAILAAGVARVVSAIEDPDPRVAGRGHAALREAGVECAVGTGAAAAAEQNRGFRLRMAEGRPWVTVKQAGSLDGRSALADGRSRWITGEAARADVQRLRARSCAVLSTARTIVRDDARLDVRLAAAELGVDRVRQPLRAALDRRGELTPELALWTRSGPCRIYTRKKHVARLRAALPETAAVAAAPKAGRGLDLDWVRRDLAAACEVNELLVEAGAQLGGALLAAGLVDELVTYVAPRLLGAAAQPLFALPEPAELAPEPDWRLVSVRAFGDDLRLRWRPRG